MTGGETCSFLGVVRVGWTPCWPGGLGSKYNKEIDTTTVKI